MPKNLLFFYVALYIRKISDILNLDSKHKAVNYENKIHKKILEPKSFSELFSLRIFKLDQVFLIPIHLRTILFLKLMSRHIKSRVH